MEDLIIGVVIAVVSAMITVWLSFRRFRSERLWERKAAAYERVFEALHQSNAFAEAHQKELMEGSRLPQDQRNKLRLDFQTAQDEIARAVNIGAFLLPEEAVIRLEQYQKEAAKDSEEEQWDSFLDSSAATTSRCLKDLVQIARRDLKVRKQFQTCLPFR